MASQLFQEKQN